MNKLSLLGRPFLCSLLLCSQANCVPAAEAQQPSAVASTTASAPFALEDGTPVKLRIAQTVSSADAHVNDSVQFEVLEDVMVGNVVVIPKGATALGTVTEAVPKRRMARGGKLEIVMDYVRLVDGEKVALRAVKDAKGGGHTGGMTIGIVAAAIVFWPAAPLFLLMHGKDITVPKGTEVPTFVNGDMKLDAARFQTPQTVAQTVNTAPSALTVNSAPVGADIYLDQNFVGNTPSTLNVTAGKHSISIRKSGYQDWVRDMNLAGGSITLNAELAPGSNAVAPASAAVQQSQMNDMSQSDVSVAEAARRNRAAKAQENPTPQQ
ncbi:MAG TPA: PEGA domain-containing protein [Candidatus Sulfotelmatobacter sp.]|nr:PEGA domain-containing protein [Candidatus Sulfotelmatobacter sp.]